jgi:hypothetical protein
VDKTTAFGLPFFYRVVLPGGVAAILLLPLLSRVLPQLGIRNEDGATAVVVFALLVGVVLDALDDAIYKVYEGLRLWPPTLRKRRTSSLQRHIDQLLERESKADPVTRGAIWADLREFPVDPKGRPYAARPTRLGNILAAYEDYPYHRYGLDAMVFWPRLWVTLSKDLRESIEQDWAAADALIHTAAAFVLVGLVYVMAGLVSFAFAAAGRVAIFESNDVRVVTLLAGLVLVFSSFIPYWLSLGPQSRNGEVFRSTFDVYRRNLVVVSLPDAAEWQRWDELGNDIPYAPMPGTASTKGKTRAKEDRS